MKRTCSFIAFIGALFLVPVFATAEPRILLVGDSWTAYMWEFQSLQRSLEERGLSEYEVKGEKTAISGLTARAVVESDTIRQTIIDELERYPSIDIVHFILGGNDLFLEFFLSRGQDFISLIPTVVDHLNTVADAILEVRPNLRILLVEYDYMQVQLLPSISIRDQNEIFIENARQRLALTQSKDRMFYLDNLGLMQATFGIPGGYAPGELPMPGDPPDHEPFIGGDPNFTSPYDSYLDAIHLSEDGYKVLAGRCVDVVYRDWLLNPIGQTAVEDWSVF